MSKKLIFIMSDSDSYLRDEVLRISDEWGFSSANVKYTENWDPALVRGSMSLFGEESMVHLDLSNNSKLKSFVSLIRSKKEKHMFEGDNWFGPGLIITSVHARGTKAVQDLVKDSGGQVIKKAKPAEMKKLLLGRINLNKESEDFLSNYVGEDYEILFPIVNQLKKMSDEEQFEMKIDDLIVRLPGTPGSVLPWEFVNPMLEGNAKEAIDLYERAVSGSHILVTMQLARTKLQLMYRLKLLLIAGIWKSDEQAKILKERNGPNIWITAKAAKKVNVETAEYLAKLALSTEAKLKGASSANPDLIFKNFIASTCIAINSNQSLPLKIR